MRRVATLEKRFDRRRNEDADNAENDRIALQDGGVHLERVRGEPQAGGSRYGDR